MKKATTSRSVCSLKWSTRFLLCSKSQARQDHESKTNQRSWWSSLLAKKSLQTIPTRCLVDR